MAQWIQQAHALEQKYGIPSGLYVALIRAESGGRPDAVSPMGAVGYAQLMPKTAQSLGVNPHNPAENLRGGAMYLAQQLKGQNGNVQRALAAYNAGPGAVAQYNGVPPYDETRQYIKRVSGYWKEYPGPGRGQVPGAAQQPVQRPQAPVDTTALSNQINRIQNAYIDAPDLAQPHVDKLVQKTQSLGQPQGTSGPAMKGVLNGGSAGGGMFRTPNGNVRNRLPGEAPWQFLQRLARVGFGLQNDPGDSQTTGGSHRAGSLHYDGRAVDFGNARNPEEKLDQFYAWASARRPTLGIEELIWRAPDHHDHLHIGVRGGPPPTIRPANTRRRPVKSKRVPS